MRELAFQDQASVHHCHGCGADNERGLRIKSYWDGEEAVATWRAEPHHCGGTRDKLNGGIIASLIDCHSLNLAIAHAYRAEKRLHRQRAAHRLRDGELERLVSASRRRSMKPIELRARIAKLEGRKAWVNCTLSAAGEIRATGEVLGMRVEWN